MIFKWNETKDKKGKKFSLTCTVKKINITNDEKRIVRYHTNIYTLITYNRNKSEMEQKTEKKNS